MTEQQNEKLTEEIAAFLYELHGTRIFGTFEEMAKEYPNTANWYRGRARQLIKDLKLTQHPASQPENPTERAVNPYPEKILSPMGSGVIEVHNEYHRIWQEGADAQAALSDGRIKELEDALSNSQKLYEIAVNDIRRLRADHAAETAKLKARIAELERMPM